MLTTNCTDDTQNAQCYCLNEVHNATDPSQTSVQ